MFNILPFQELKNLYNNKEIIINPKNIKSASIDLTISNEISFNSKPVPLLNNKNRSFLIYNEFKENNKKYFIQENPNFYISPFKKYIIKLNEKIHKKYIDNNLCIFNTKSSIGRLDIIINTVPILNEDNNFYDIYIELISKSFYLKIPENLPIIQVSFFQDNNKQPVESLNPTYIPIRINFNNPDELVAYQAIDFIDKNKPIDLSTINDKNIYFNKNYATNNSLTLRKNKFYIIASDNYIDIPPNYCGIMEQQNINIGDFKIHYAGFFDPNFGHLVKSKAICEVRCYDYNLILHDNDIIGYIKLIPLTETTDLPYGSKDANSNYQGQDLRLSKYFTK